MSLFASISDPSPGDSRSLGEDGAGPVPSQAGPAAETCATGTSLRSSLKLAGRRSAKCRSVFFAWEKYTRRLRAGAN